MVLCFALAMATASGAATLPTASVSGLAVSPNPTCSSSNPSGLLTATANISGTFDQNSDTKVLGALHAVRDHGTITGYTSTDTETIVVVSNKAFTVTGPDSVSQILDGSSNSASYTSGTFPVGTDGQDSVSISAAASEVVTTEKDTIDNTWAADGITLINSVTTPGTPSSVTNTSLAASGSATYLADMNPPSVELKNFGGSRTQGGEVLVHLQTHDASPNQAYTYTVTLTSEADPTYVLTVKFSGTFRSLEGTKEPNVTNDLPAILIPCDAPLGTYDMDAELSTTDICGGPYDVHLASTVDIGPGTSLTDSSFVISDYGVAGYGFETCFTATASGTKINTYPGSNHIATLVTTEGPCAGFVTVSGVTITQTIPFGFAPFAPKKPLVGTHVFAFDPPGADLHYPGPEVVLGQKDVKYTANTNGTWTVTITVPGTLCRCQGDLCAHARCPSAQRPPA